MAELRKLQEARSKAASEVSALQQRTDIAESDLARMKQELQVR